MNRYATFAANAVAFALVIVPWHACRASVTLSRIAARGIRRAAPVVSRFAFAVAFQAASWTFWAVAWLSREAKDAPAACRNVWRWGRSVVVHTAVTVRNVATFAALVVLTVFAVVVRL